MQNKIKILIADDNPNIRQTLKNILTERGYLIETVKDGYELLTYLREKSSPNILILDLMMPEKDGVEVFPVIKSLSPNIKIIIYTGFQKYENSIYARMADKFLQKNDDPKKLLQVIAELA